mmetsp:Transcript_32183/g.91312  ORF Transcript_32183/g.91312 Transcript_32183/m.91312 type:complete len:486 (+) Transcript_32183:128-1585(+)
MKGIHGSGGGGGSGELSSRGRIISGLLAVTLLIFLMDVQLYESAEPVPSGLVSFKGARFRAARGEGRVELRSVDSATLDGKAASLGGGSDGDQLQDETDLQAKFVAVKVQASEAKEVELNHGDQSAAGEAQVGTPQTRLPPGKRGRSIWMPCYDEVEAGRLGVRQWQAAKPKGMKSKEFDGMAKCWRKRGKNDPLLPEDALPPTSSLRLRMGQDWLEQFLFVHQGNLRHLGHGFTDDEGGTLSDNPAVASHLPETGAQAVAPLRAKDCAVVGSGGSLTGAKQGKDIDRHDVVLRVNEAPVAGYERDVGRSTEMRLLNNLWTSKYSTGSASSRPLEKGSVLVSTRADGDAFLELGNWLAIKRPDVTLRLMSSRVVTAVRQGVLVPWRQQLNSSNVEALQAAVLEGRDTPSSGLISTFLLIQLCDKVTVYGFSGINDGNKYHYYKTARRYQNRTHSFTAERALLRALHRDGIITFVEGNPDVIHTWV